MSNGPRQKPRGAPSNKRPVRRPDSLFEAFSRGDLEGWSDVIPEPRRRELQFLENGIGSIRNTDKIRAKALTTDFTKAVSAWIRIARQHTRLLELAEIASPFSELASLPGFIKDNALEPNRDRLRHIAVELRANATKAGKFTQALSSEVLRKPKDTPVTDPILALAMEVNQHRGDTAPTVAGRPIVNPEKEAKRQLREQARELVNRAVDKKRDELPRAANEVTIEMLAVFLWLQRDIARLVSLHDKLKKGVAAMELVPVGVPETGEAEEGRIEMLPLVSMEDTSSLEELLSPGEQMLQRAFRARDAIARQRNGIAVLLNSLCISGPFIEINRRSILPTQIECTLMLREKESQERLYKSPPSLKLVFRIIDSGIGMHTTCGDYGSKPICRDGRGSDGWDLDIVDATKLEDDEKERAGREIIELGQKIADRFFGKAESLFKFEKRQAATQTIAIEPAPE